MCCQHVLVSRELSTLSFDFGNGYWCVDCEDLVATLSYGFSLQFQFNERLKAGSSATRPVYYNKGSILMAERVEVWQPESESESPRKPAPTAADDLQPRQHDIVRQNPYLGGFLALAALNPPPVLCLILCIPLHVNLYWHLDIKVLH